MKKSPKIRLLVVDDHFVVRMGLVGAINAELDMTIVAECGSGEQALELFRRHPPERHAHGLAASGHERRVGNRSDSRGIPQARVVLLSVYEGEEDVFRAVRVGVAAYLPKSVEQPSSWRPSARFMPARPISRRPLPPSSRPGRAGRN